MESQFKKGLTIFFVMNFWMAYICTYFFFQTYHINTILFALYFLIFFGALLIFFLITIALRYVHLKYYSVRSSAFAGFQLNLKISRILIFSLQGIRLVLSLIFAVLLNIFFENLSIVFMIMLMFVLSIELLDCFVIPSKALNFSQKKREKLLSLDDFIDSITRWIFYFPFFYHNLWILFFFILQAVTISIATYKHELRWIKLIAPDLNFIIITYFFFLPLFPLAWLFSFGFYIMLYTHHLFPSWHGNKDNQTSSLMQLLDTLEEIQNLPTKEDKEEARNLRTDVIIFFVITLFIFVQIFLFSYSYLPFDCIYSLIFTGSTCIIAWIIFFICYKIVSKRKEMLKRRASSYRAYGMRLHDYLIYEKILSRFSEKQIIIGYVIYMLFRYLLSVVFLFLLIITRQVFLIVLLFATITEIADFNFDSAFILGIKDEHKDKFVFLDDLTDVLGRMTFYTILCVPWMNYFNVIQLLILILIVFLGFQNRWMKMLGIDINIASIIFFLPPYSNYFIFGITLTWLFYCALYLTRLFDRHYKKKGTTYLEDMGLYLL